MKIEDTLGASKVVRTLATMIVAAALAACSTAVPTDTPGVTRVGEFVLKQESPTLESAVGFRFAASRLGEEWLILEAAFSSPQGATAEITRDNVFVRSPDGTKIPLATQKEFSEAYGSLRSALTRANVVRDPLGYFPAGRSECTLDFFVTPGESVSFDKLTVNDRRVCEGKLFFKVPGGVQPGRWVLGIDLEEEKIRIPFELSVG